MITAIAVISEKEYTEERVLVSGEPMQPHLRKLILARARLELAAVSDRCLEAIEEIDRDSEGTVVQALGALDQLDIKLDMAVQRLLVLRDAEHDAYLSPYLLQPAPPSAGAILCRAAISHSTSQRRTMYGYVCSKRRRGGRNTA